MSADGRRAGVWLLCCRSLSAEKSRVVVVISSSHHMLSVFAGDIGDNGMVAVACCCSFSHCMGDVALDKSDLFLVVVVVNVVDG
jgi:hypothetical protein